MIHFFLFLGTKSFSTSLVLHPPSVLNGLGFSTGQAELVSHPILTGSVKHIFHHSHMYTLTSVDKEPSKLTSRACLLPMKNGVA
jgi:hypothetical protein